MPSAVPDSPGRARIRPLEERDRETVARMLESAHRRFCGPLYPGHDPATAPWRDANGEPVEAFLAEIDGVPVGVMAVTARGEVAEWSVRDPVDPDRTIEGLLAACEAWARSRGAREIQFLKPGPGPPGEAAMAVAGYRRVTPPIATLRIVHFPGLLAALAEAAQPELLPFSPFSLALTLSRGRGPALRDTGIAVRIGPERTTVEAGSIPDADARARADTTAYSEFLFGARGAPAFLSAAALFETEPAARAEEVRRILTLLKPDRPWFAPMGQHR